MIFLHLFKCCSFAFEWNYREKNGNSVIPIKLSCAKVRIKNYICTFSGLQRWASQAINGCQLQSTYIQNKLDHPKQKKMLCAGLHYLAYTFGRKIATRPVITDNGCGFTNMQELIQLTHQTVVCAWVIWSIQGEGEPLPSHIKRIFGLWNSKPLNRRIWLLTDGFVMSLRVPLRYTLLHHRFCQFLCWSDKMTNNFPFYQFNLIETIYNRTQRESWW